MSSIGTASRASGITVETIRYYERAGIVGPPPRSPSGRRIYGPAEIGRLRMIRRCRDLGFSLADVQFLMSLAADAPATCAEVKGLAEHHLAAIRQKQRDLALIEGALAEMLEGCSEGNTGCPALRTLAEG